jgi:hypothetical protein
MQVIKITVQPNDKSCRRVRVKMKLFSLLPPCLRKCVNLNNSFVLHCVKVHRLTNFIMQALQKQATKTGDNLICSYNRGH